MRRLAAPSISLVVVAITIAGCAPSGAASPAGPQAAASSATATSAPAITALPGCLPGCVTPNIAMPGALPAGPFQTRYFFGGQLIVPIPDGTWLSREDSTGELELHQGNGEDRGLEFWLDAYPIIDPGTTPIAGFDGTAKALVDWVAANPNLGIEHRGPGKLGGLSGEVIEFGRASDAKNVDPDCPVELRPCVGLFGFPQWDGFVGEGGPFKVRLYAADARWGDTPHAIYAFIWANDKTIFDSFAPAATKIVEGATMPSGVGP
jgi:hypothetical protein